METTIANVISNVGTFFTGSIGWLDEAVEVVANNPILFIMVVAMPVAVFAVGLLSRLIRL